MSKAIVLTHGLFMQKVVMTFLEKEFNKLGYKVYNYNYNTLKFTEKTLENFNNYVNKIEEDEVYFVGHSMGGMLARLYFQNYNPTFFDTCIVTLATPHKGSSFGNKVKKTPIGFVMGSASSSGITQGLPEWERYCDLGCIVGVLNVGLNNIFNAKIGMGDGTVLKEEAYDDNAKDVVEVNCNHTAIIYSKEVVELTDNFIKYRKFKI